MYDIQCFPVNFDSLSSPRAMRSCDRFKVLIPYAGRNLKCKFVICYCHFSVSSYFILITEVMYNLCYFNESFTLFLKTILLLLILEDHSFHHIPNVEITCENKDLIFAKP